MSAKAGGMEKKCAVFSNQTFEYGDRGKRKESRIAPGL